MRGRTVHIIPWSLASIYFVWFILVMIWGGDWAPIFLYYPLWPFSIALEALIKTLPENPDSFLSCLVVPVWVVGGIIWCLFLGYLIPWVVIRISRLR
jgi:hypothetical protein